MLKNCDSINIVSSPLKPKRTLRILSYMLLTVVIALTSGLPPQNLAKASIRCVTAVEGIQRDFDQKTFLKNLQSFSELAVNRESHRKAFLKMIKNGEIDRLETLLAHVELLSGSKFFTNHLQELNSLVMVPRFFEHRPEFDASSALGLALVKTQPKKVAGFEKWRERNSLVYKIPKEPEVLFWQVHKFALRLKALRFERFIERQRKQAFRGVYLLSTPLKWIAKKIAYGFRFKAEEQWIAKEAQSYLDFAKAWNQATEFTPASFQQGSRWSHPLKVFVTELVWRVIWPDYSAGKKIVEDSLSLVNPQHSRSIVFSNKLRFWGQSFYAGLSKGYTALFLALFVVLGTQFVVVEMRASESQAEMIEARKKGGIEASQETRDKWQSASDVVLRTTERAFRQELEDLESFERAGILTLTERLRLNELRAKFYQP